MPTPPALTAEQRRAAGAAAVQARAVRADLRRELAAGRTTLAAAFDRAAADDPGAGAVGAMQVRVLLESLPGVGDRIADHVMTDLAIPVGRRVRGLGPGQRAALVARFP
ncbi:integration host factor, actinobacterial type [Jatrophihabitans sp. YIM 134969]